MSPALWDNVPLTRTALSKRQRRIRQKVERRVPPVCSSTVWQLQDIPGGTPFPNPLFSDLIPSTKTSRYKCRMSVPLVQASGTLALLSKYAPRSFGRWYPSSRSEAEIPRLRDRASSHQLNNAHSATEKTAPLFSPAVSPIFCMTSPFDCETFSGCNLIQI